MNTPQYATDAHVAGEVRAEMARQRLAIRDVASRMGVTHTWLHRRMTGATPFSVGELDKLADVLKIPMEKLLRGRKAHGAKFLHSLRPLYNKFVITRTYSVCGS